LKAAKLVFTSCLVVIFLYAISFISSCKKDSNTKDNLAAIDDIFLSFTSSNLTDKKQYNEVDYRGNSYLNDQVILANLKIFVLNNVGNDSLKSVLTNRFGYPIWDKVVLLADLNNNGNKFIYIPMAKSNSRYTLAILPVFLDNSGVFHATPFIPRFNTGQATEQFPNCKEIRNAKLLTKFDYEIFNRVENFHSFLSSLNCDSVVSNRCNGLFIEIIYYTTELQMVDHGGDGGWSKQWQKMPLR
jgi:hypothetical protein